MEQTLIIDNLFTGYYKIWVDYHASPVTSPVLLFNIDGSNTINIVATRQITLPAIIDTSSIPNLTVGNGLILPVEVADFELFILYGISETAEFKSIEEPYFYKEKGYWKISGTAFIDNANNSFQGSVDALWHYYFPKEIISIKAEKEFFK